jgi:hypothetical protein
MFKTKKVQETPKAVVEQIKKQVEAEPIEEEQEIEEESSEGKVVEENVWSLQTIPTQTTDVIYNSKTDRAYTLAEAVIEILNRTEE